MMSNKEYWPSSFFCVFMDQDEIEVNNTAKKEGGQYQAILREQQCEKKIIFTVGKLKLAFTNPEVISASPEYFLNRRIDFAVRLLSELLKKHHLPVWQVKNRVY